MPITSVTKDPERLEMTVVADFTAPLQRLWDAYTDPRQLEKFWGPPTYPSKFVRHDVFPGGFSHYAMTGPEGDSHAGYWAWVAVTPPADGHASFEVRDGFANPDYTPVTEMPSMRMVFAFSSTETGSRLTTTSYFDSAEQLQQVLDMGAEEGMREAMAQIDDVLADLRSYAAGIGTEVDLLSDTQIRVTRIVRGTVEQVWRAHMDPELQKQWMTGPDGWEMITAEPANKVGAIARTEWAQLDGSGRFGFISETLELDAPHRAVSTERMIGTDGPSTTNELTLTAQETGTLVSIVITYPSVELRDEVIATGMVDGMESSFARLEGVLA